MGNRKPRTENREQRVAWQDDYIQRYYIDRPGWINGTVAFHDMCQPFLTSESRVLEIGPGPTGATSEFLSKSVASVTGLDIDDAIKGNPFLTEAHIYDGGAFPFKDEAFDAVVADYVMEHVKDPHLLATEAARVLKPGGAILFRTPNVYHYVSVFSRFLPDAVSRWARRRGNHEPETYPKFFRCNSSVACRGILEEAGFKVERLMMIEKEPSYGMRARILFLIMMLYERLVNSSAVFRGLRANILCAATRPAPSAGVLES